MKCVSILRNFFFFKTLPYDYQLAIQEILNMTSLTLAYLKKNIVNSKRTVVIVGEGEKFSFSQLLLLF